MQSRGTRLLEPVVGGLSLRQVRVSLAMILLSLLLGPVVLRDLQGLPVLKVLKERPVARKVLPARRDRPALAFRVRKVLPALLEPPVRLVLRDPRDPKDPKAIKDLLARLGRRGPLELPGQLARKVSKAFKVLKAIRDRQGPLVLRAQPVLRVRQAQQVLQVQMEQTVKASRLVELLAKC